MAEVEPHANPLKQPASNSKWKPLSESDGYLPINTSSRLTYIISGQNARLVSREYITKQLTAYFKRSEIAAQNIALGSTVPTQDSCSGFQVCCSKEKEDKKKNPPGIRLMVDFFHFEFLQLQAAVNYVSALLLEKHDKKDLTVGILVLKDVIDRNSVLSSGFRPCCSPVPLVEHSRPVFSKCVKKRVITAGVKDGPRPNRRLCQYAEGFKGDLVYGAHVLLLEKDDLPRNWIENENTLEIEILPVPLGGASTRFHHVNFTDEKKPSKPNSLGQAWLKTRKKVLGVGDNLPRGPDCCGELIDPLSDDPRYQTIRPDRILFSYPTSKIMKIDAEKYEYETVRSKLLQHQPYNDDPEFIYDVLQTSHLPPKRGYRVELFHKNDLLAKDLKEEFEKILQGCPAVAKKHMKVLFDIRSDIMTRKYEEGKFSEKACQNYRNFQKAIDSNATKIDAKTVENIKEYANTLINDVEESSRGLYRDSQFAWDKGIPSQMKMDREILEDYTYCVSDWIAEGILSMRYGEEAVLKYEDGIKEVQYVAVKLTGALTNNRKCCGCMCHDGLMLEEGDNKTKNVLYCSNDTKRFKITQCIGCLKCLAITTAGLIGFVWCSVASE